MKQKILCVLFLFLQFAYAQTPGIDILEKESRIKSTINSKPDSARIYIKQILDYKGKLHDTVYASTYLYYGFYYNLKNSNDSALYYYNKASNLLNEQKTPKLYARMLRNKAVAYKKKSNYSEALKLLDQAEQLYISLNDQKGIAIVYGEMASNYNLILKSDDAIRYLLKSIAILEKTDDKFHIAGVKLTLANTYLNAGNLVFAADLYKETLAELRQSKQQKSYAVGLLNYGDCLIRLDRFVDAQEALLSALPIIKKFEDYELETIIYSKLGTIKMEQGNFQEAEAYFETALNKAISLKSAKTISIASEYIYSLNLERKHERALKIIERVELPELLQKTNLSEKMYFEAQKALTYQKMMNPDKRMASVKNILELQDTIKKTANHSVATKLQRQYQDKYQVKKSEKLKSKNAILTKDLHKSKIAQLIPIICLTTILILVLTVFVATYKKNKRKLLKAKNRKELLIRQYENAKNLNLLNGENLEHKKQELMSGMISLTTLEGNINKLVAQCIENPEKMHISEIKAELESLISDNDYWKLFRKRFNEAYTGFQQNLEKQFPVLTKNDLFFCALLKLNLPYKDMAILMQVSPESIVKKKYRVKKKMKIDTEQELETILLNTSL